MVVKNFSSCIEDYALCAMTSIRESALYYVIWS